MTIPTTIRLASYVRFPKEFHRSRRYYRQDANISRNNPLHRLVICSFSQQIAELMVLVALGADVELFRLINCAVQAVFLLVLRVQCEDQSES